VCYAEASLQGVKILSTLIYDFISIAIIIGNVFV